MPNRVACVGLLLFWVVAASALFLRDLLPNLILGSPPDLRTIAMAGEEPGPTRWAILVTEANGSKNLRSVGQVVTETSRKRDGWVRMSSHAWFDTGELLRGTPFAAAQADKLGVVGACDIDPSGNLHTFRAGVRLADSPKMEVMTLEGRLRADVLEVTARGPIPLMSGKYSFAYRPRGVVQNSLGTLERMPGLQVGQRWKSLVVSPLSGQVEDCTVEVVKTEHITWDNNPVVTLVVITRMKLLSAKTWVRRDGLVLRQEVPLPFTTLLLERLPKESGFAKPPGRETRR